MEAYVWYARRDGQRYTGTYDLSLDEVVIAIQEAAAAHWDSWSLFTVQDGNPADRVARITLKKEEK